MSEDLRFADRGEFRKWLQGNASSDDGVWLIFGKAEGPKTLKASDALEEALCFGWIDGQMQKIEKLVVDLEKRGLMTEHGRSKIEEAKANGQWDAPKAPGITDEDIERIAQILEPYEKAHANFLGMSPSVRKTYTRAYLDAKTDAGREKRLAWMVDRLNRNLKPM